MADTKIDGQHHLTTLFHPAVATWFDRRFPEGPTPAQSEGWPLIARGEDALIAAPTGSGKTLAGFLTCIDFLYKAAERGESVEDRTQVVYVSPLKALGVDIAQNLDGPLGEIAKVAAELGMVAPRLRAEVRNGDTPASVRAAMLRRPPNFLVTTPESLYLMVTAERSRQTMGSVRTIIVDEIHAVARDKRGSHLAVTLERLSHLCDRPPQRVGLSATQRPISTIARLLVGSGPDRSHPDRSPKCQVVDVGHQRHLDLALELPDDELAAVTSAEQMADILDRIATHVRSHRTTLVFVNTRRMAERVAHLLAERLGDDAVAAHHGSLSKERRLRVETRLRAGDLRALVATASLELGIDIGPVELVCQLGSPRSLATFLQRVGRSGHTRRGTPKGRLYPTTRDELVECAALLAGVRCGRLDAVAPPVAPLDILAQQVVAECSAQRWDEEDLYQLFLKAAPYGDLSRSDFDDTVAMVSDGIITGRGRRAAYIHHDKINHTLTGRRGARLAALTSGGAIPEVGDYRVVAEPDDTLVGTVNEDWAIESMAGDVFLLGTTSWRIRRVEAGVVRVIDAQGAPPSIPFWLGEAPARTDELSEEVSKLRSALDQLLSEGRNAEAINWLAESAGVRDEAARMLVAYLAAARTSLGSLPTQQTIVLERFFDETGGMQLVLHSPFGSRVNRALGLALRKRFCVTFDFELQAAASDDAVLLSLGPQHSFSLDSIARFLSADTVEGVIRQAVLASPLFAARWRWNLNRSLAVLRYRGGRKNPPPIQRMEADDLMAAVFPALAACQENAGSGPLEIPEHPLVRQTMYDCLHEAMDIEGLKGLLEHMRTGRVSVVARDTTEPSPLAHEILNGRPYTFLDDAPLEERRSRAVPLRRGLPVEAQDLTQLIPEAIDQVAAEATSQPRDPDELHDTLLYQVVTLPRHEWADMFKALTTQGRCMTFQDLGQELWCTVEQRHLVEALWPGTHFEPDATPPSDGSQGSRPEREEAAAAVLRGHLDSLGPVTQTNLVAATCLSAQVVAAGVARLEAEGFALLGHFDPRVAEQQVCSRRLLARIHHYSRRRQRQSVKPATAQDFMRFLLRWQHVSPTSHLKGERGLLRVLEQLQGFELSAAAWEQCVLPTRIAEYRVEWLDHLGMSGDLAWGRLGLRSESSDARPSRSTASRATPITLALRADLPWLLQAARGQAHPVQPVAGATRDLLDALSIRGALFRRELAEAAGRLPAEIDDALWDGVARGLVTADGFGALRALLSARTRWEGRSQRTRRRLRAGALMRPAGEGRWALLPEADSVEDADELAEAVAEQLLARWGVVFRDLMGRETLSVPWRDVLMALRRMEARGTARGGRFVTGFAGEQYALAEAADELNRVRKQECDGEVVQLSGSDPLNLVGTIVPGARVPAIRTNVIIYVDGLVQTVLQNHG